MARYSYSLGAGHNLPLGSLTNVEMITPTGDVAFYAPQSWGNYDPGQYKMRGDGIVYTSGHEVTHWRWRSMTRKQYQYLQDTYCNGGQSGTVTAYTLLDNPGTYERCNATMILPKLPDAGPNFSRYTNVDVLLVKLERL